MTAVDRLPGPFPFGRADLEPERLGHGIAHTLADFARWKSAHPATIAAHVDRYADHLAAMRRAPQRTFWGRKRTRSPEQTAREVAYFAVYDMSEIPDERTIAELVAVVHDRMATGRRIAADLDRSRGVSGVLDALEARLPLLSGLPERQWLIERLDRLHRSLPETVVRAGGLGKVVRTMTGVLAIAAYDTFADGPEVQRAHLTRVLPGAYAYGAAYAIVDDTLQDLAGDHLPAADRDRCDRLLRHGLATGKSIPYADVPDHPLAEQLHELFGEALLCYPYAEFRHLYHAAEAMYLAQHRDAARSIATAGPGGLAEIYPDVFGKAGMSRVVANILGRRHLPERFYARCLNTILVSQFKDDLVDRAEDGRAGRVTPFTVPLADGDNPLYDLFAYEAYVGEQVFQGDPTAVGALTYFGALKLATHLGSDPGHVPELVRRFDPTPEIVRCLRVAGAMPRTVTGRLTPADMALKRTAGRVLARRDPGSVEPRAYVLDRLGYIDEVIRRHRHPGEPPSDVDRVIAYTMDGGGKRLRPALTLMLADSLAVAYHRIEPLLAAGELFHTASLVFDDLPAQDDATLRRGRPAAHLVFDEGLVQLAGIAMLSAGFGALAKLDREFPAARVTEIVEYAGSVLGPSRLCRGQALDLRPVEPVTAEQVLEVYELKTSTMLEAALVPLMMLTERPEPEIGLIREYARHAGVVFQLRDDLLDATSVAERLGKDTGQDADKATLVRLLGEPGAARVMLSHLDAAVAACAALPFDTRLLSGVARHFAFRRA
ncbi:MAG: hypothetical protein HOU81_17285 [Hamadaea sp.]|uniref:polyprenyl synthetase family protein n=1 Tax=Hamadaea sp. TaxID=2024425 RepID=UPI0017E21378|nr:polyprenyl synthetase family protein [Hamadaea sp.]NUR72573.1 hypothetical protein [Hamadaea sp.]NUT22218.1 hypothetical protein [Hamadaea sp.]